MTVASDLTAANVALTAANVKLEEIKGVLRNSNIKQAEILEEQITSITSEISDIATVIAGL